MVVLNITIIVFRVTEIIGACGFEWMVENEDVCFRDRPAVCTRFDIESVCLIVCHSFELQLNIPGIDFVEDMLVVRHADHLECFRHEEEPPLAGKPRTYNDEYYRDHCSPTAGSWVLATRMRWLNNGLYAVDVLRAVNEPSALSYSRESSSGQVVVSFKIVLHVFLGECFGYK